MLLWTRISIRLNHFLGCHENSGNSVIYPGTLSLRFWVCLNLSVLVDRTLHPFIIFKQSSIRWWLSWFLPLHVFCCVLWCVSFFVEVRRSLWGCVQQCIMMFVVRNVMCFDVEVFAAVIFVATCCDVCTCMQWRAWLFLWHAISCYNVLWCMLWYVPLYVVILADITCEMRKCTLWS